MTLPKPLRDMLGIPRGGAVLAEAGKDGIVLRPAVSFPIEIYSDARIAAFDRADTELARHLKKKRTRK